MLLLQVTSLVVGISLLASVEASLTGDNVGFLGVDPNGRSSKGNEFVLGFMGNAANASVATATAALLVTTDDPTGPVEFTVEYFGISNTFEARKGSTTLVRLPVGKIGEIGDIRVAGEDERNKGIRVKATDPTKLLAVYGINDADASTDAFLALPCHAYPYLVYKYFVFSANTVSSTRTFRSRFLIVPCEDNTQVTISPTQQIQANADLAGAPVPITVWAGSFITITVNRLQTAQFNSDSDLTGTIIESNKPISVFVGHECGQVPEDMTACDHLVEQIPPDAAWGTQFFTAPLDERESGERYRVGTVADNNQVTVTCTTEGQSRPYLQMTQTLQSGGIPIGRNFLEFDTRGDGPNGVTPGFRHDFCCIETTKPAIVMMYSKGHSLDEITLPSAVGTQGDPFMLLIPPLSQYSNDYTATTAKQVRTDFIGHISFTFPIQFFDNSAVSHNRLTVNGTAFIPDSGYYPILCANNQTCGYGAYSGLPVGDHQVNYNLSGAAMNLFVYGFLHEVSFGYPAGFEMEAVGVPRITIYNITVLESIGTVVIPINRTGGDLSRVSVIHANSRDVPGQAQAGIDYRQLSNFRIRWRADQVDPRYIPHPTAPDPAFVITIVDDSVPEPREYFEIDLTLNPSGRNGFFYPRAVGRVTIIDDDTYTPTTPSLIATTAVPPTSGPDLTPPDVESHCSHVNWLNSPNVSCGDISGYILRLFNPDTNETVERRVGTRGTFHNFLPSDKDLLGKKSTTVQVRVVSPTGEGPYSSPIEVGCYKSPLPNVYFELKGKRYDNNSEISILTIGEGDDALLCKTDKQDCCGTKPNRFGEFYFPHGVRVLINRAGQDFYRDRGEQLIRLNRRSRVGSSFPTGRYFCEIPDANNVIQKIFINIT